MGNKNCIWYLALSIKYKELKSQNAIRQLVDRIMREMLEMYETFET